MSAAKDPKPQRLFAEIFDGFRAPVVPLDCGQKCKHLNDGVPVCCDVGHAVPIMSKNEFALLRARSDLWRRFKPSCAATREIVDGISSACVAAECKGAQFCERDNRSLSCRAFPFFPYIDRDDAFLGLAPYWTFEDRCWVISNMGRVTADFVEEFFVTYEKVFDADPEERDVFRDYSATMRRVHSRWRRPIHVIDRERRFLEILPKGAGVRRVAKRDLPRFGAYADDR